MTVRSLTLALTPTLTLAVMLSGCSATPHHQCLRGEEPRISDVLYFGTRKHDGLVSPSEWDAFLRRSVTPRFEQGFTVWAASGQWRGADGERVREPSYVLSVVHADDERREAAVREIMSEYKSLFQQEAVLRVRSHVCVSL